jgi:hypothetical protein
MTPRVDCAGPSTGTIAGFAFGMDVGMGIRFSRLVRVIRRCGK